MLPVMCPLVVPGMSSFQNQEVVDHGPGLYAVSSDPFTGLFSGHANDLIPIRYRIPTRPNPASSTGSEQGLAARDGQGPQRQVVVRRFEFAIQVDILLILKLLAVVILFSQDGSRQRLITLLLFAAIVYLQQTGALAPLVRWLRLQAVPPQQRPAPRAANAAVIPDNINPLGEARDQPGEDRDQPEAAVENENPAEPVEGGNGGNQWGIVREIKMILIGFITSLLPGFHHHND